MAQLHAKTVHAADGTALYVEDWWLKNRPSAGSVVIMHGLGEHRGRYEHVVRFFVDCGFSVRTYDHRGHGKSGGKRGDIPNGEPFLQDAQILIDDFSEETGNIPILLGHSMGGLFAARFALQQRSPLRALILSSPALALYMSGLEKFFLKVMLKLGPGVTMANGLPLKYLSHDPKNVQTYQHDPLVHNRVSARLIQRMLSAINFCQSHAGQLKIPCLLLVAGSDRLVDPTGSYDFFRNLPHPLAQMQTYPDLYHELFNELEADKVFADLREWLFARGFIHEQDVLEELD